MILTSAIELAPAKVVTMLAALACPPRVAIVKLLTSIADDQLCAGDIAAALDIPPSTLSFHLKELAHADLLIPTRCGRAIFYRANTDQLGAIVRYLSRECCVSS